MDIQPIVCLQRTTPPSPATANAQPQLEKSTCVAVGSRDLPARGLCMTCPAEQPHSRCGCDATANAQPILGVSVIRRHPPPFLPPAALPRDTPKCFPTQPYPRPPPPAAVSAARCLMPPAAAHPIPSPHRRAASARQAHASFLTGGPLT